MNNALIDKFINEAKAIRSDYGVACIIRVERTSSPYVLQGREHYELCFVFRKEDK